MQGWYFSITEAYLITFIYNILSVNKVFLLAGWDRKLPDGRMEAGWTDMKVEILM